MAGKHLDVLRYNLIFFSSQIFASMLDHTGSGKITLDYYVPVAVEKGKEGNLGKAEIR